MKYRSFELNTSFNRNIFFLNFVDYILKVEFTYFPFAQIEKPKIIQNVKVDSIIDIAVNKFFTIYQKPRSRDFIDLYMIQKKYKYSIKNLLPKLLMPLKEEVWQNHFNLEARYLGNSIISQ